jgi:hypothetical protein
MSFALENCAEAVSCASEFAWQLDQLIGVEHPLIGDNDAFVGKQPSPQPNFERARLLFFQRVEEYVPGNH